jgi:putative aldouronate transport system permease protein
MAARYRGQWSRQLFMGAAYAFLVLLALLCVYPVVYTLALSFSSSSAASAGLVRLWPVRVTTASYQYVLSQGEFLRAFGVSLERVAIGVPLDLLITVLIAYPLSKETAVFRWRTAYVWFFVITMLFGGGLIPLYMVVRLTHLLDSIWALILPGAVRVFDVVLLLNFFRTLPRELEEAAFVDGAGHWTTLWKIYLPLSKPALATIGLLTIVFHWNSWFDGIIFMNSPAHYPLQSYLETLVVQQSLDFSTLTLEQAELMRLISDRTVKAAQIFIAAVPVMAIYPFLQRYFVKGIVLGSVKG